MDLRGIGPRERAGIVIAARHHREMVPDQNGVYHVPSQSNRRKAYEVTLNPSSCECPDNRVNQNKCKHIWAADLWERGDRRIFAEIQAQPVRTPQAAYPRDWSGYTRAKENRILEFDAFAYDLCRLISPELKSKLTRKRGRPRVPIEDLTFSVLYRTLLKLPGRDLKSILVKLHREGYVNTVVATNTIFDYIDNEDFTDILKDLVIKSSMSLASVNGYSIAVDSTWFNGSRSTRQDDNDFRGQSEPRQVKLHFACCPRTHVITAALVLDRDSDDGNQLPELLDTSARNRAIHEVLADKGYSEVANLEKIASVGALSFIPFPERQPPKDGKPSKPNPSAIWRAALLCYSSHREYFRIS
jgi:hypothetical protein